MRVAAGELAGMWLLLDLQVDKDLWLGTYEPQLGAAIRRFARPGGVAYDLGANVGYTALLLARAVGPAGRVLAFEPLPSNLDRLRQAVALNGLDLQIDIVAAAAGSRSEAGSFLVHDSGGMGRLDGGLGRTDGFVSKIAVDIVALDDFVFRHDHPPPSLVKLDLEGGEREALLGMRRLLREERPTLMVELHGGSAHDVIDLLAEAGYVSYAMRDGYAQVGREAEPKQLKHIVALPSGILP
jgi:FkbM family methyltransferase